MNGGITKKDDMKETMADILRRILVLRNEQVAAGHLEPLTPKQEAEVDRLLGGKPVIDWSDDCAGPGG